MNLGVEFVSDTLCPIVFPFLSLLSVILSSFTRRRLSCSLTRKEGSLWREKKVRCEERRRFAVKREEGSLWREFHSTWVRKNSSSFNEIIPSFIPSFVSTSFSFLFHSSSQTLLFWKLVPFLPIYILPMSSSSSILLITNDRKGRNVRGKKKTKNREHFKLMIQPRGKKRRNRERKERRKAVRNEWDGGEKWSGQGRNEIERRK